jgi:hypothetical protein
MTQEPKRDVEEPLQRRKRLLSLLPILLPTTFFAPVLAMFPLFILLVRVPHDLAGQLQEHGDLVGLGVPLGMGVIGVGVILVLSIVAFYAMLRVELLVLRRWIPPHELEQVLGPLIARMRKLLRIDRPGYSSLSARGWLPRRKRHG